MLNAVEASPVPFKDAFWGLPAALSETVTAADSLAAAEGLKVTLIVQLPLAARVAGEVGQLLA